MTYFITELTVDKEGEHTQLHYEMPYQHNETELYDRINVHIGLSAIKLFNLLTKLRIGGIMYVKVKNSDSYPIFRRISTLLTRCSIEFSNDNYMIIRKAI